MINGGGASEAIQQRGFKYIFQTAARISAYVDGIDPLMSSTASRRWRSWRATTRLPATWRRRSRRMAEKNKVQIVMSEYFPPGTVDFSSQIARARQQKPDLWVSVGYPNEAIEMVRQFRASNFMPKVFVHNGVSQEDFLKATGKDGESRSACRCTSRR